VKGAAASVQAAFAALDWIAPLPDHFLHVWLGPARDVDVAAAKRAWAEVPPFSIVYQRANCFHSAVFVEAHSDGVAELVERALPHVDLSSLLPHMSVGYTRHRELPDDLQVALRPQHELKFGTGVVGEVLLCDVPIARSTILEPWRVIGSVTLGS
jgi:hypothetical protein